VRTGTSAEPVVTTPKTYIRPTRPPSTLPVAFTPSTDAAHIAHQHDRYRRRRTSPSAPPPVRSTGRSPVVHRKRTVAASTSLVRRFCMPAGGRRRSPYRTSMTRKLNWQIDFMAEVAGCRRRAVAENVGGIDSIPSPVISKKRCMRQGGQHIAQHAHSPAHRIVEMSTRS